MKNIITILAGLTLMTGLASAQSLTVHEWGTFTTLHGSTGGTLSSLYFEEEPLPPFVYHFPGFSPDPAISTTGYMPCKDVTVKMETPVLYFYSPVERAVQVHVDFPRGAISQWYPNRSGGEAMPSGSIVDFDNSERNGSIEWKATVLDPKSQENFTQTQNITPKWDAPRQTYSNLVKNDLGEVEKYLFYRGVANFSLPVDLKFNSNGTLSVSNTSQFDIPFIYIYDHPNSASAGAWGIGPLHAGETRNFSAPSRYYSSDSEIPEYTNFRNALYNSGLTTQEADALLATWDAGYFQTTGFKVFWIVPRQLTDQILPLQITPKPDSLERVLVGKTEILTPVFEQQLVDYYKANGNLDQWKSDRYHLAYSQRVQQLLGTAGVNAKSSLEISLTPNPAATSIQIRGASGNSTVTIRNLLGETVLNAPNVSSELDIHALPEGLYFVLVANGMHHETLKLIKR